MIFGTYYEFMNFSLKFIITPFSVSDNDVADHPITRSQQQVIWSLGQVFPDYFHRPGSGIEAGTAEDKMFYKRDEIKYHGTRNRGATTANFYGEQKRNEEIIIIIIII